MQKIPNRIVIFRMVLVIPLIAIMTLALYYFFKGNYHYGDSKVKWLIFASGMIFLIAMISDYVDGYLARKFQCITTFGKIFDPLADKIICSSSLIMLSVIGLVPFWITLIFILRDIVIASFRHLAIRNQKEIAASFWGKLKTLFMSLGLLLIFFLTPFLNLSYDTGINFATLNFNWKIYSLNIVLFLAMIFSLVSLTIYGRSYLRK